MQNCYIKSAGVSFVFFLLFAAINTKDFDTLQLVNVIFRHGNRMPDTYCNMFIPDSNTYWPDGYGALTLEGKQLEYNLGVALRGRYDEWLGKEYYPEILYARSTDYGRTKMSLELVLAGLFPPTETQVWNPYINWQPIPWDYEKKQNDALLSYPVSCPRYELEYEYNLNSTEVQNLIKQNEDVLDYLAEYAPSDLASKIPGWRNVETAYGIYFCLFAMNDIGTPLPAWSQAVFPEPLENLAVLEYQLKCYTPELKRLSGGRFIREVLTNTIAKINGHLVPEQRKLFLYSAHEFNIAETLCALNCFVPHAPKYGSYIIIELHQINGEDGYKIFYQNYTSTEPHLMTIPGCGEFCRINDFQRILQNNIPNGDEKC